MAKNKKRALLGSALSLLVCVAMLIGTTYAWFTDSVKTGVNIIQSGNLEIVLEYSVDDGTTWEDAEGKTLNFIAADGRTDILWEPGCTYELPLIRVRNNGNLALKYNMVINGIDGDAKLLEAIEFTANGSAITNFSGELKTKNETSTPILIKGHMKEEATNEYQGLSIEGIGITVFATQLTHEKDSNDENYDKMATVDNIDELNAALAEDNVKIILGSHIALTETLTIPAGKTVAIDLAGFTISQTAACTQSYNMIANNGKLTIMDNVGTGKISFTDTGLGDPNVGWASYTIRNSGTLVVDGGTIEHLGKQTYNGNNAIFSYSGDLTINGGKISAPYSRSVRQWQGTLTINGGTFDGQVWVQPTQDCTTTINGGSFKPATYGNDGSSVFVTNTSKNVALTVTGGNFATRLGSSVPIANSVTGGTFGTAPTAYIADGYLAVANADGTFSVVKGVKAESTSALNTALANGNDSVYLGNGTYSVSVPAAAAGEEITITGNGNTVMDFTKVNGANGASITFENLKITGVNSNTMNGYGIQSTTGNIVYKNCTFENAVTNEFYGNVSYIDCTFNGTYYISTYSVKSATFDNCTFDRTDSRALLVYSHGNNPVKVTVKKIGRAHV